MVYNKYTPMRPEDWDAVAPWFHPEENWGDPDKIDARLVHTLYRVRLFVGRKIIIHCGYEHRKNFSYHEKGVAVDLDIAGMHPMDQFFVLSRYDIFNGIGVYFHWNNPGCHVDTRPYRAKFYDDARWMSSKQGKYLNLTAENIKNIL